MLTACLKFFDSVFAYKIQIRRYLDTLAVYMGALALIGFATAPTAHTQTFTTLINFTGSNGASPEYGSVIQGIDGHFYGTTFAGGTNTSGCEGGCGTVFKLTPAGVLTTLYSFCASSLCADGSQPSGPLVQGADGNFYGTTYSGGVSGEGTAFKITPGGALTTIHSFDGTDGSLPNGGLIQVANDYFYGTTQAGGNGKTCQNDCGTIFKISPAGEFTSVYSFNDTRKSGATPYAGLALASNGNFYGTTTHGGTGTVGGPGSIFEMTPAGTVTTLLMLSVGNSSAYPYDSLILGADGNFYGTSFGGHEGGAVFQLTPSGVYTSLYSAKDFDPEDSLVLGTDGNFYGTSYGSGGCDEGCGTVFEITPTGTLTTLYSFDNTDGKSPYSGLMQSTNGIFYGMTSSGGTDDLGTLFSLSVGLSPFVSPRPSSGPVGKKVTILGTNLTGATAVSFNGTPATFTVTSSAIDTTVPAGAATGAITVTLPSGTLTSNINFNVTP
jgi:uncharacterized repeat protein (TIGR03803 family)